MISSNPLVFTTSVQKESICVKMSFFPEEFANANIFFLKVRSFR